MFRDNFDLGSRFTIERCAERDRITDSSAIGLFRDARLRRMQGPALNVALVTASLKYIMSLGVANIQAHRLPLLRRLQDEVPRLGFVPVTPPESKGPIVTFVKPNLSTSDIPRKLQVASVNVRIGTDWMRVSPSVYNDMRDVERLLDVLS